MSGLARHDDLVAALIAEFSGWEVAGEVGRRLVDVGRGAYVALYPNRTTIMLQGIDWYEVPLDATTEELIARVREVSPLE